MPAERAPMRKVREVLRLRHALGVSERQIAVTIGVSRSTVGEYLRRAAVIGIIWPMPEGLDETPAQPLPSTCWPTLKGVRGVGGRPCRGLLVGRTGSRTRCTLLGMPLYHPPIANWTPRPRGCVCQHPPS